MIGPKLAVASAQGIVVLPQAASYPLISSR